MGVSAAIVQRGRLRWSGGSGVGDLRTERPVTADLWHVPSRGITVAVLTNDECIHPTEVADGLLRETIRQR